MNRPWPKYDLPDKIIYIEYAYFPCDHQYPPGWPVPPPGWNVPEDTVVAVKVKLKKAIPLSSVALDPSKFEKVRGDYDLPQHFYYMNWEEGFGVEFFDYGGDGGEVITGYIYQATAKDEELFRCKEQK